MQQEQQREQPLGVFWNKNSSKTGEFISGVLKFKTGQELEVVLFQNKNKQNDKSPDWYMWKSKPKESQFKPYNNQQPQYPTTTYPRQSNEPTNAPLGNLEEGIDIQQV